MDVNNRKTKVALGVTVALAVGFLCGFLTKDIFDQHNLARATSPKGLTSNNSANSESSVNSSVNEFFHHDDLAQAPVFSGNGFPSGLNMAEIGTSISEVQTIIEGGTVKVVAQVPEMTDKDVKVEASDNSITIKAHKSAKTNKDGSSSSMESSSEQTVSLPCKVKSSSLQSTVKNGVLTVVLQKAAGKMDDKEFGNSGEHSI